MLNQAEDFEGLELLGGRMLKVPAFADDHQVLCRTTQKSLDACSVVIQDYELISGLLMSWEKSFTMCSGNRVPLSVLPGLLHMVHILQAREKRKYLGLQYGPGAEDIGIGEQLLDKLQKKCSQLQSLFHTLAARAVIMNFILMGQLWYFLMIWVPT